MINRILFVCLGNICRSPAAEGIFLHLILQQGLTDKFFIDSAGTGGWHAGSPPDHRMVAAAERRGIHLPSIARKIQPSDLTGFDMIITMDSENTRAVESLAASFTDELTLASVEPITTYRRNFHELDIPDPYYGGPRGFEHVLDLLEDSCRGLLDSLA